MVNIPLELITLTKPYYILLIIPNIFWIILEKSQSIKILLSFSLFTFSSFLLFQSLFYIDIWITFAISITLFLFSLFSKEKFNIQGNFLIGDMEKFIYEKDFRNILSAKEFNFLFSSAKPNRVRENNSNVICFQNENFNKIYYFAIIPLSSPIDIKKNEVLIGFLKESSWFGIIELARELDEFLHPKIRKSESEYGIDLNINKEYFELLNRKKYNYLYSLSVKDKNYDIIYYEWEKDVILLNFLNFIY